MLNFNKLGSVFGAPAGTEHVIQNWLRSNCSDFINKGEWPPNSPDLNLLDFHVCEAMLEAYYKLQPKPETVRELKDPLQQIWTALPQKSIVKGVNDLRK